MEMNNRYVVCPASGELGRSGFMRLSGYQQLVCFAAESDLTTRHMSIGETVAAGYAWAITSLTVDVEKPIRNCTPLTAQTWLSAIHAPICRRELEFRNEEGVCVQAAVFSVPVGIESHRIIKPTEAMLSGAQGEILLENVDSRITGLPELREVFRREVYPSDIDALGHMNNCRYGALAYDALTEKEREGLSEPYRFTINFRRQLFEGSTVAVSRGEKDGMIYIVGQATDSEKPSFVVRLEF